MIFNRNDIDDDSNNDMRRFKLPLIIVGGIILLVIIILLISKLFSNKDVVYEDDKLYYIDLVGETTITLYLGDDYVEEGYKGFDEEGNDITGEILVSDNIDINQVGDYKVTYTLGNVTKERNVKVIEKPIGATYIHLYGDVNVFLYIGEAYVEKGYMVIDSVDGTNLKNQVKVTSDVNTQKEGIYHVTYTVTNTSGVTTSKERTVIVMDRNLSLIPNNTNMTNGNVTINIYVHDELFSYLVLPNKVKVDDNVTTYDVSNNGTYKFVMYNKNGESKEKSITINNIDRESPSGSCTGSFKGGKSNISVNANDNIGISKYVIDGTSYTSNNITINKEISNVNMTIYDKAGNTKTISCKLVNKNPTPTPKPTPTPAAGSPLNASAGTFVRSDYDSSMSYIEIMPDGATIGMGVVIYLDGAWSYASFPDNVLGRSITNYVKDGSAYREVGEKFLYISPRYVISDGKNGGLNWWGSHGPREAEKIAGLVEHLYKKYRIDKKRVYITGVSLGGDGVFYMINAYPSLFAAGVAVSGCAFDAKGGNFTSTPLLGYNGTGTVERNTGYYSCVPSMVSKINSAGGHAESRVKRGWDHGNMIDVYKTDQDVFKWMFKYKRS